MTIKPHDLTYQHTIENLVLFGKAVFPLAPFSLSLSHLCTNYQVFKLEMPKFQEYHL